MARTFEGENAGEDFRIAAVVARYREEFTAKLLDGALRALDEASVDGENIDIAWVPGAFEIPIAAKRLAESGRYDAIVCLGVVMRSDSPHFDFVAGETSRGIMEAGLQTGVPTIFGVLTVDDREQAVVRTLPDDSNRGYAAARAGLQMASLLRQLD